MTGWTLARREPLTVGATAPLFCAVVAAVAVLGSATAALIGGEVGDGWQEAGALTLLGAAGAVLTVGAGPFLAPFRGRLHALVLVLLLLAAVLDGLAHRDTAAVTPLIACPCCCSRWRCCGRRPRCWAAARPWPAGPPRRCC